MPKARAAHVPVGQRHVGTEQPRLSAPLAQAPRGLVALPVARDYLGGSGCGVGAHIGAGTEGWLQRGAGNGALHHCDDATHRPAVPRAARKPSGRGWERTATAVLLPSEGGRHRQAERGRLLLAQPGTELPEGLLASLARQELCHRPTRMFPLWLMDDLPTHPTRKQLSGLHANLGQGEDGKASHCAVTGYAGVGASPVPHQEPDPGGPGRTPQLDQGHRGGGRRGHTTPCPSRWMNASIQFTVMAFRSSQEQPGMGRPCSVWWPLPILLPAGWVHPGGRDRGSSSPESSAPALLSFSLNSPLLPGLGCLPLQGCPRGRTDGVTEEKTEGRADLGTTVTPEP